VYLVSPNLVRGVTVGGDSVGAYNHRRDLLLLQRCGNHVIADQSRRYLVVH